MKILYIVHDFFPRFYGGTERYVLNISKQMLRMGHSVTVLSYGLEEPLQDFVEIANEIYYKKYIYEGIPVISIRHKTIPADIGFVINDERMETAIEFLLKDGGFQVMHIAHPMRMASSYKAAKKCGIPIVMTVTDFWLLCPRGRFYKPDYSLCNSPESGRKCIRDCGVSNSIIERYLHAREMFESIDMLISPSRFLIGIFKSNGWDRNMMHINHGVDYKYIDIASTLNYKAKEIITFGYIGVVTRFKGVDILLNAFTDIPLRNIQLNIYGNCFWDVVFEKQLAEAMSKDKRIRLMGKYDHKDMPHVMKDVDIMVVPSTTMESYGLVVIESMAYKKPVIASDIVGSAYEFIKHGVNGFIFQVENPASLKDIMITAVSEPHMIERLRKGITPPPRIEEEAFMVESLYRSLFRR